MTTISPSARLVTLATNVVAQTTPYLSAWEVGWALDRAGHLSITVASSDAGDAAGGGTSYATALIAAAGGPGLTATPIPTLHELSLDGGTSYDARKLVTTPRQDLRSSALLLTDAGDDIWTTFYQAMVVQRVTLTDVHLADALGGNAGAIAPISAASYPIIATSNQIPFIYGIMNPTAVKPGAGTGWASGALARLQFLALCDQTVAFGLPTNVDVWGDYVAKVLETIAKRLGGVFISSDTVQQSGRGHYVVDSSDSALNLSSTLAAVVCDGTPTVGTPAGTNGYSNASGRGGGVSRTVTIGNAGGVPAAGFAFKQTPAGARVNEATEAIIADGMTIAPDLTTLYGACSFIGGSNKASWPDGAQLTCLTTLNNTAQDDAWTTGLPVVGMTIDKDRTGGLYYYMGDGQLRPWPNMPAVAVLDLTVDNVNSIIYVATPHGVISHSTNIKSTSEAWVAVGGLNGRVTRLAGVVVAGVFTLYALVQQTAKGRDGVYVRPAVTGTPAGAGYSGWTRLLVDDTLVDAALAATDGHSFFTIKKADQGKLLRYDTSNAGTPVQTFSLPAGIKGLGITRLTTAAASGHTAIDSVWVSTTGDTQGAYYTTYDTVGLVWRALLPGNQDGSLVSLSGATLQINRVVSPAGAINGVYIAAFACTNAGLFYITSLPTTVGAGGWTAANGQNGLADIAITNMAAPQNQLLAGISTYRLFAINQDTLFYSNSSAAFWGDLAREHVTLGPFFSKYYYDHCGLTPKDLPSNSVQTIGPMAASPLGLAANTHLQVAGSLPTGWYWQRFLNERLDWAYRLVNTTSPLPGEMTAELADIQVNEVVNLITASTDLGIVMTRWLGDNSKAQSVLTIPSSFTQQNAGLRKLRPSHQVPVTFSGTILQRSSTGAIIGTQYVNLSATPLYVLAHSIKSMGAPGVAETTTSLGTLLSNKGLSPQDVSAALQDQIKAVKARALRGRR